MSSKRMLLMLSIIIVICSAILLMVNATKPINPPDPPAGPLHDLSQCEAAFEDARAAITDLQIQVAQLEGDKSALLEQLEAVEEAAEEAQEQCEIDKATLRKAIQDGDAALQAQLEANAELRAQLDECLNSIPT